MPRHQEQDDREAGSTRRGRHRWPGAALALVLMPLLGIGGLTTLAQAAGAAGARPAAHEAELAAHQSTRPDARKPRARKRKAKKKPGATKRKAKKRKARKKPAALKAAGLGTRGYIEVALLVLAPFLVVGLFLVGAGRRREPRAPRGPPGPGRRLPWRRSRAAV